MQNEYAISPNKIYLILILLMNMIDNYAIGFEIVFCINSAIDLKLKIFHFPLDERDDRITFLRMQSRQCSLMRLLLGNARVTRY